MQDYSNATIHFLDCYSSSRDEGLTLTGFETTERDFEETNTDWDGSRVSYTTKNFTRTTFHAPGFALKVDEAVTIRGLFKTPVKAIEFTEDDNGEELSNDWMDGDVDAAIVAKCGNIACLAEIGLI